MGQTLIKCLKGKNSSSSENDTPTTVNPKKEKDLTVEILEQQGENKGGESLLDRPNIEKNKKKNENHQNTENEDLSMQIKEAENKKNPEFDHEQTIRHLILPNFSRPKTNQDSNIQELREIQKSQLALIKMKQNDIFLPNLINESNENKVEEKKCTNIFNNEYISQKECLEPEKPPINVIKEMDEENNESSD